MVCALRISNGDRASDWTLLHSRECLMGLERFSLGGHVWPWKGQFHRIYLRYLVKTLNVSFPCWQTSRQTGHAVLIQSYSRDRRFDWFILATSFDWMLFYVDAWIFFRYQNVYTTNDDHLYLIVSKTVSSEVVMDWRSARSCLQSTLLPILNNIRWHLCIWCVYWTRIHHHFWKLRLELLGFLRISSLSVQNICMNIKRVRYCLSVTISWIFWLGPS